MNLSIIAVTFMTLFCVTLSIAANTPTKTQPAPKGEAWPELDALLENKTDAQEPSLALPESANSDMRVTSENLPAPPSKLAAETPVKSKNPKTDVVTDASPVPTSTTAVSAPKITTPTPPKDTEETLDSWTKKLGEKIILRGTEERLFIRAGKTMLVLEANGKLTVQADDSLTLESKGDLLLKADGDIKLEAGKKVTSSVGTP